MEISPRDIIYTQPAEPLEGEHPTILHKLDFRYGYGYNLLICIGFFSLYLSACQCSHDDIYGHYWILFQNQSLLLGIANMLLTVETDSNAKSCAFSCSLS